VVKEKIGENESSMCYDFGVYTPNLKLFNCPPNKKIPKEGQLSDEGRTRFVIGGSKDV
jgi:hypothetical protein